MGGGHKRKLVRELKDLQGQGWVIAYTDSSAKRVRGCMQEGYGVWYGEGHANNFSAHVLAHGRQSISRGELRGVQQAMLAQGAGKRLVVVLDSEYAYKGITV